MLLFLMVFSCVLSVGLVFFYVWSVLIIDEIAMDIPVFYQLISLCYEKQKKYLNY